MGPGAARQNEKNLKAGFVRVFSSIFLGFFRYCGSILSISEPLIPLQIEFVCNEDTMSLEHSPARQRRVHQERLIGEPECREITDLSRAQRWRLERDGRFPRRLRLGPHTVRWRLSEILAWIANLPTASPERPPHGMARGASTETQQPTAL
jgi:prophage regulatory protein